MSANALLQAIAGEVDRAEPDSDITISASREQWAELSRSAAATRAKLERLMPYVQHRYGCEQHNTRRNWCSCGLIAALDATEER